jgi:formylmethanofuran dehydrogenase subunit C
VSALTLKLRARPDQRLDLSPLTPTRLAGLPQKEIETLSIGTTKQRAVVGDWFDVSAGDAADLHLVGLDDRCDHVGAGLEAGEIVVEGDVGAYLGRSMRKGRILVKGSAGPFAGGAMKGGAIRIEGDAGERAGGVIVGETFGMRGGTLEIRGNAGPLLGERLRRGIIVVGKDAGDYAGARAIAGTIAVKGEVGRWPGYGLRRASLVLTREPKELLPTYADCGELEFDFLNLLDGEFARIGASLAFGSRARRYMGDMAVLGKGEILIAGA